MSPKLAIEVDARPYERGETIRGVVQVAEGGRSRGIDVELNFHETSIDYDEVAISVSAGRVHTGELPAGGSYPFELTVPADAPPEFISGVGQLHWSIDARSDEFGPDTVESFPVVIGTPGTDTSPEPEVRPGFGV